MSSTATDNDLTVRSIRMATEAAEAQVIKTTEAITHYAANRIDSQWSVLDSHLRALAERDLWAQVAEVAKGIYAERNIAARDLTRAPVESLDDALLAAVVYIAETLTHRLLNGYIDGRSTSETSNACSAIERRAASAFVTSYIVEGARQARAS